MDSCQASSPDDDIAIARKALAEGDVKHALHHLAGALAADPNRPDWLALLDEALSRAEDPLALLPIKTPQPPYFGTVALHAYALAHLGRVGEAVDLILQIIHNYPNILYIEWANSWLRRPEAKGKVNTGRCAWFVSSMVKQFPALRNPHGGGRATLDRLPDFIRLVRQTQPADPVFLGISVSLLRRMNCLDEALEYAKTAYEMKPGFQTAVSVAVAHESRGELEPALAAYRDALRFDPKDVSCFLSMGDLLWDHGRLQDAEKAYRDALDREPEQPWALPSWYYLRWVHTGEEGWRDKLMQLADTAADNQRARQMADLATPYVGYLPEPSDATTNMFKQAYREHGKEGKVASLSLTAVEAPSNYLAFPALYECSLSILRAHEPDVRKPRRPVDHLLWKYDGDRPSVAVPPPDAEVAKAVEELAKQPYRLDAWVRHAARVGQQLGPGRVRDLLAAMVHPPAAPEKFRPWAWVFRHQVAAALIVSQVESAWEDSARKKALWSLAYGPMDWTVDAALVALSALARDEEQTAEDVAALFRDLRQNLPRGGAVCYYGALLWLTLRLPNLEADERAAVRKQLSDWLAPDTPDDRARTHFKLAEIHEKNKEHDKALEELTKALEIKPDYVEALTLRGGLYIDTRQPEKAVADLTKAVELWPEGAYPRLCLGEAQHRSGQDEAAVATLTEAIRLKPDDWRPYYWRGLARRDLNQSREAIGDFTEVLKLNPNHAWSLHLRGQCYAEAGEFDKALADQNEALRHNRDLAAAYFSRALCHESKGDRDKAISDYTQLLRLNPKSAAAWNRRAMQHYFKRNYVAALADHAEAYKLKPDDPQTCNYLAWIWATCPDGALRDGAKAVRYATKACELTGWDKTFCLDTLAAAYAESGRFDEAVKHGQRVVELAPEGGRAEYQQRLELYRAGKAFRDA